MNCLFRFNADLKPDKIDSDMSESL